MQTSKSSERIRSYLPNDKVSFVAIKWQASDTFALYGIKASLVKLKINDDVLSPKGFPFEFHLHAANPPNI